MLYIIVGVFGFILMLPTIIYIVMYFVLIHRIIIASELTHQYKEDPNPVLRKRCGTGRMVTALMSIVHMGLIAFFISQASHIYLTATKEWGLLEQEMISRGISSSLMPSRWEILISEPSNIAFLMGSVVPTLYMAGLVYFSYQAFKKYHTAINEVSNRSGTTWASKAGTNLQTAATHLPQQMPLLDERQLRCKGCGSENEKIDRFCYTCGNALS